MSSTLAAQDLHEHESYYEEEQEVDHEKETHTKDMVLEELELTIEADISSTEFIRAEMLHGETYSLVRTPEAGRVEPGKPDVPVFRDWVMVPQGTSPRLEVNPGEPVVYDDVDLPPVLLPRVDTEERSVKDTERSVKDTDIFERDADFPGTFAEIGYIQSIRGQDITLIESFPYQYNPIEKQLKVYGNLTVTVDFIGEVQPTPSRFENTAFETIVRRLATNADEVLEAQRRAGMKEEANNVRKEDQLSLFGGGSEGAAEYLIVTDPLFESAAEDLAEWRDQMGIPAYVTTTDETGSTADEITSYIQDAYDTWDPSPEYLLIMGDAEFIPPHYETEHGYYEDDRKIGTDIYYATMEESASDYFPDLSHGRMTVETESQAQSRVDEIIKYEKDPVDSPSFYETSTHVAQFDDSEDDGYAERRFTQTSEDIAIFLEDDDYLGEYSAERIYEYTNDASFPNGPEYWRDPSYFDGGPAGDGGDPIPQHLSDDWEEYSWNQEIWGGDADEISSTINDGTFLVTHRNHGGTSGWSTPSYRYWHVEDLTNDDRLPVVWSLNCNTGYYDHETCEGDVSHDMSFVEAWERNPDGGAAGVIAATRVSYSNHNDRLAWGFLDAIWPEFLDYDGDHQESEEPPLYRMGDVLNYGKYYYATNFGHYSIRQRTFEMFHWFGDPTMQIRTEFPQEMNVDHPSEITAGTSQQVTVTVEDQDEIAVEDARVALRKYNEIYEVGFTDSTGEVTFTVGAETLGDVEITATKHNFIPYENTMTVSVDEDDWHYLYDEPRWFNGTSDNDDDGILADGGFYQDPQGYAHDNDYIHDNIPLKEGLTREYIFSEQASTASFRFHLRYQEQGGPDGDIENDFWQSETFGVPEGRSRVEVTLSGDGSSVDISIYDEEEDGSLVWSETGVDASDHDDVYFSNYEWAGGSEEDSLRLIQVRDDVPQRSSVDSGIGVGSATWQGAIKIQLPQGELTDIAYYHRQESNHVKGYIHEDGGDEPGAKLGETEQIDDPITWSWHQISLQDPVEIHGGYYWIVLEINDMDGNHPFGVYGPRVDDGDWISTDGGGTWNKLTEWDLFYTWSLEARVSVDEGEADLQLQSISYPNEITLEEDLHVDYTIENLGDAVGTESTVWLLIDGTGEDHDEDVTVEPGETVSGTLVFQDVQDDYEVGDMIEFEVWLSDFDESEFGETEVIQEGEADLQLQSISYPDEITLEEDLHVDYTIENLGDAVGTESFVDLVIDNDWVDTHEDVTVEPGETVSGTLVFQDVQDDYEVGDVIEFSVELWDFGDSEFGETEVVQEAELVLIHDTWTIDPDPARPDETVTISGDVENIGGREQDIEVVDLYVDDMDSYVDEYDIENLGPGETETVIFTGVPFSDWGIEDEGIYDVKVELFLHGDLWESDFEVAEPTYTLGVDVEGGGSVDIEPDQEEYEEGTEVELTAVPDEGWLFVEWTGDVEGTEEEITVVMDSDKEVTARFQEDFDLIPPTGFTVQKDEDTGNIYIQWDDVGAFDYNVYHSEDQYEELDTWTLLDTVEVTSYVHENALGGENYYMVRSVDEEQESEPSTICFSVERHFMDDAEQDLHYVSLPAGFNNLHEISAGDVVTAIEGDLTSSDNIYSVVKWDHTVRGFTEEFYFQDLEQEWVGGENFVIEPGDGIGIRVSEGADFTWHINGVDQGFSMEFTDDAEQDLHYISLPYTFKDYTGEGQLTASDVVTAIEGDLTSSDNIYSVVKWDHTVRGFTEEFYFQDLEQEWDGGENFVIEPGDGIGIRVSEGADFTWNMELVTSNEDEEPTHDRLKEVVGERCHSGSTLRALPLRSKDRTAGIFQLTGKL